MSELSEALKRVEVAGCTREERVLAKAVKDLQNEVARLNNQSCSPMVYVCNECGNSHSVDNVVPICAICFHRSEQRYRELEARIGTLTVALELSKAKAEQMKRDVAWTQELEAKIKKLEALVKAAMWHKKACGCKSRACTNPICEALRELESK